MLKRMLTLFIAAMLMVSLCACGASAEGSLPDASKDPKVMLTFGGCAETQDLSSQGMRKVAELAKERSGGTIDIRVFTSSQLGNAAKQLESCTTGAQDMMMEAEYTYMYSSGVNNAGVFSCGVNKTQEDMRKIIASDEWKELQKEFTEKTNLLPICSNWLRLPTTITSTKPLHTLEDFKDVRLRTVGAIGMGAYSALGFSVTNVAFNEVYLSLQQGMIDATTTTLDLQYTMGFYEVTDYLADVNISTSNYATWINQDKWNSMTEAQQIILKSVLEEVGEWYVSEVNALAEDYTNKMKEKGIEVIQYDDAFYAEVDKRLLDVAKQFEAEGKWDAGYYEKMYNLVHAE